MLGMQATDASSANQTDFQRICGHGAFPFLCTLQPDGSKIGPVTLGTRFGTAHTREDILLHDDPSVVTVPAQPLADCVKRHAAHTQFAKHPVLHCHEIVPAFCAGLLAHLSLAILEIHIQDTLTHTVHPPLTTRAP